MKLLLSLAACAILASSLNTHAQDLSVDEKELKAADTEVSQEMKDEVSEEVTEQTPEIETDESLWGKTKANINLNSLSVYLAAYPNGKYSGEAQSKFDDLQERARVRAKEDKALEAYRKRGVASGLVLELNSTFNDVKPYIRSMLNSCGYKLVEPHRFAKRVYPTLAIRGQMFNGKSDSEHAVTLDLSLVLKTKNREIKARKKMSSYRTSPIGTHQAHIAAFEDIGAQMKTGGFCRTN